MTDKLIERALQAITDVRHRAAASFDEGFTGVRGQAYDRAVLDCYDAVRALESLTLPQTDLEQGAREMLPRGLNPHSYLCQCVLHAITKALASSSVPEQPIETAPEEAARMLAAYAQSNGYDSFTWKGAIATEGEEVERFTVEARLQSAPADTRTRIADLEQALNLALSFLIHNEPGDSRAVSNEFVAMAYIQANLAEPDALDESRQIIAKALAVEAPRGASQEDGRP